LALGLSYQSRNSATDRGSVAEHAPAEVQPTNLTEQDSLCGLRLDSPRIISDDGVGPLDVYMSIETVRAACHDARDTVDSYGIRQLVLHALGSTILVAPQYFDLPGSATGPVAGIAVMGGQVATQEGIRPGSLVAAATRVYGPPTSYELCASDELAAVQYQSHPAWRFVIARCDVRKVSDHHTVPHDARVLAIEISHPN
jgi:hypothetical protein